MLTLPLFPFFWSTITRLGEALILLPAAAALALWLTQRARGHRLAYLWLGAVALAALITTVTKVAFIGWGVGSARFNFTGVSGHTMFATAIYPLLLRTAASTAPPRWHAPATVLGLVLAVLIGVSRVQVGAHSWSEVVLGWLVGGAASGLALWLARVPRGHAPRWLVVGLLLWLVVLPMGTPSAPTHSWVTQLSLALSGRSVPYTRADLHRAARVSLPRSPSVAFAGAR